ncbi:arginine--tRNA ligase [Candidatus Falkowbacteria bacterium]|nr:arginine--tRNA ligase [Candidatus Falkowbacteria bacterium]
MDTNLKIKNEIVALLKKHGVKINAEDLREPPEAEMGDLSLPCFVLSKELKKAPEKIAEDLAKEIKPSDLIINIKNIGPYLNFLLDYSKVAEMIFLQIKKERGDYGVNSNGKGIKVMIEYSQPNTHKEFHIGHVRNVAIGSALVNLYRACGYKVIAANYLGDIGAHVAKVLWYMMNYVNETDIGPDKGEFLGQAYVRAVEELNGNPELQAQVQDILKRLEEGKDKDLMFLWQQTRKWSLDAFNKIYDELDIKFNIDFFESVEEKDGKKMLPELMKLDFIKESEGAIIADLEKYKLGVLVLLRADGTSLYGLKDIPLAIKKFKKYKVDKSLYLVDTRQSQYLEQIFKILELMGFKKEMIHVPYEFVELKSGIISSRTGNIVTYEEVRDAAMIKVANETKERHADWDEKKISEASFKIFLAALKFGMIRQAGDKIITFDLEEALKFDGFTGPYLQYTNARLNSILKKADEQGIKISGKFDYRALGANIEKQLIKDLIFYPQIILMTQQKNDPSILAQFLFSICQNFNTFYHELPVLKADENIKLARLVLIKSIRQVLENGLVLLGIPILKEM